MGNKKRSHADIRTQTETQYLRLNAFEIADEENLSKNARY